MSQETLYFWSPLTKSETSSRTVTSPITGPNNVDYDGQILDLEFIRQAVKPWMRFGNVRQSHDSKRPIGKTISIDLDTPDRVPVATMKIVDDAAWKLVQDEVLSGVSVGIKNPRIIKDAQAPRGRIIGGDLVEISLVDHPANPHAKLSIMKTADNDTLYDCQTGETLKAADPFDMEPWPEEHPAPAKNGKHPHGSITHKHHYYYEDHMHCPDCGEDASYCTCRTEKAADAFRANAAIKMPDTTSELSPAQPTSPDHGNSALDSDGPLVKLQYELANAVSTIKSIAAELKSTQDGSRFNPNAKPHAHEGLVLEVGATPADATTWHGTPGHSALGKGVDPDLLDDAIEKGIEDVLSSLFDPELLTKSAAPDSIQAAFVQAVSRVATEVAKQATAVYDERLAKVEDMAAPAKGWRSEVVEKQFTAAGKAPANRAELLDRMGTISEKLNPEERTALTAAWISEQLKQPR